MTHCYLNIWKSSGTLENQNQQQLTPSPLSNFIFHNYENILPVAGASRQFGTAWSYHARLYPLTLSYSLHLLATLSVAVIGPWRGPASWGSMPFLGQVSCFHCWLVIVTGPPKDWCYTSLIQKGPRDVLSRKSLSSFWMTSHVVWLNFWLDIADPAITWWGSRQPPSAHVGIT